MERNSVKIADNAETVDVKWVLLENMTSFFAENVSDNMEILLDSPKLDE